MKYVYVFVMLFILITAVGCNRSAEIKLPKTPGAPGASAVGKVVTATNLPQGFALPAGRLNVSPSSLLIVGSESKTIKIKAINQLYVYKTFYMLKPGQNWLTFNFPSPNLGDWFYGVNLIETTVGLDSSSPSGEIYIASYMCRDSDTCEWVIESFNLVKTNDLDLSQELCSRNPNFKWSIGGDGLSATQCCGDDANEFVTSYQLGTGTEIAWGSNSLTACCNITTKCVDKSDNCVSTGTVSNNLNKNGNVVLNDNTAYCSASKWYDCDTNPTAYCNNKCKRKADGASGGAGGIKSGEITSANNALNAHGEYSATDFNVVECCGDDANEYYIVGVGNPNAACCNSPTDSVKDGKCISLPGTPLTPGTVTGTSSGSGSGGSSGVISSNPVVGSNPVIPTVTPTANATSTPTSTPTATVTATPTQNLSAPVFSWIAEKCGVSSPMSMAKVYNFGNFISGDGCWSINCPVNSVFTNCFKNINDGLGHQIDFGVVCDYPGCNMTALPGDTCSDTETASPGDYDWLSAGTISGVRKGVAYSYTDHCMTSATSLDKVDSSEHYLMEYNCNNGVPRNYIRACTGRCNQGKC